REKAPLAANSTMFVGRENMSVTGKNLSKKITKDRGHNITCDAFGGSI
ncbi:unnamed protein product, partial [Rotaria sp. Silwood1]